MFRWSNKSLRPQPAFVQKASSYRTLPLRFLGRAHGMLPLSASQTMKDQHPHYCPGAMLLNTLLLAIIAALLPPLPCPQAPSGQRWAAWTVDTPGLPTIIAIELHLRKDPVWARPEVSIADLALFAQHLGTLGYARGYSAAWPGRDGTRPCGRMRPYAIGCADILSKPHVHLGTAPQLLL